MLSSSMMLSVFYDERYRAIHYVCDNIISWSIREKNKRAGLHKNNMHFY